MSVKKKLQHKMRQTFYTPKIGRFSILKTIKALDSMEKSLSEGVGNVVKGKKNKKNAVNDDDDKSKNDKKES